MRTEKKVEAYVAQEPWATFAATSGAVTVVVRLFGLPDEDRLAREKRAAQHRAEQLNV